MLKYKIRFNCCRFVLGGAVSFLNAATHGINSVCVVIDIFLIGIPHRLLHVWLPMLYGGIFVIFSAIYWGVDNDNVIYSILDYGKEPVAATVLVLVLIFIGIPVCHFILFCLYWLRVLLYSKCCNSVSADLTTDTSNDKGNVNPSYVV